MSRWVAANHAAHIKESHMIDAATRKFISETPLTSLLPISAGLLDACTAKAYALCATQAYANAEVISRGLVAAEPANWYYRTLLAVCLHKLHRRHEAMQVVEVGLRFQPAHPELLALRAALTPAAPPS